MFLRTEGHQSPGPEEAEREDKGTKTPPPQTLPPLEERATHFRDMLLERGVRPGRAPQPPRRVSVTVRIAQGHFASLLRSWDQASDIQVPCDSRAKQHERNPASCREEKGEFGGRAAWWAAPSTT